MSKRIVRMGSCLLLLAGFAAGPVLAAEAPGAAPAATAPAVLAGSTAEIVSVAALAGLFRLQGSSCPSARSGDGIDPGVMELLPPVKVPINLAACGNCPGVCNSDPGCVGKVLGDVCDTEGNVCLTEGAGCPDFNCCTCGYR